MKVKLRCKVPLGTISIFWTSEHYYLVCSSSRLNHAHVHHHIMFLGMPEWCFLPSQLNHPHADMIFVKSFTQARFQQIWKFTPITRKPRHVLPPKTPFKSKQMWDSPTVLLRYALSLLYNINFIKNHTKIFEIEQDVSSPTKNLPNFKNIYTSAACDACDKYHVWIGPKGTWPYCGQQAFTGLHTWSFYDTLPSFYDTLAVHLWS